MQAADLMQSAAAMQAADLLQSATATKAGCLTQRGSNLSCGSSRFTGCRRRFVACAVFPLDQVHRFEMGRACHAALWS